MVRGAVLAAKRLLVENVGAAVGISSPSVSVQKLLPLPVSWPTFDLPMHLSDIVSQLM